MIQLNEVLLGVVQVSVIAGIFVAVYMAATDNARQARARKASEAEAIERLKEYEAMTPAEIGRAAVAP